MISIKQILLILFNVLKGFFTIDNVGAFVLPIELRLQDQEFLKYIHLDVDWDVDSISAEDLPGEFGPHAVKLVDLFRRKTANLPYECMLYFDYKTGQIIYCFIGNESGRVRGEIYEEHFKNFNVASIHNHPKGYLSAPSGKNFQILEIKNEKYELICGYDEFWILEAEGTFDSDVVDDIKKELTGFYNSILVVDNIDLNSTYGDYLLNYINHEIKYNIKLTKVRYR